MSDHPKRICETAVVTVRSAPDRLDHRETANRYRGELVRRGRYRIVLCRDGIQWIVQRKKSGAGARWQALGYCVTRKALTRLWTAATGEPAPKNATLPEPLRGRRND